MCKWLAADWNKISSVVTALATVGALIFSGVAIQQNTKSRREDQRDRLLGTLIDQLTKRRLQEQRLVSLQREMEPSKLMRAFDAAPLLTTAKGFLAQIASDIEKILMLHAAIAADKCANSDQLSEWRLEVDTHGTIIPAMELQIDELTSKALAR